LGQNKLTGDEFKGGRLVEGSPNERGWKHLFVHRFYNLVGGFALSFWGGSGAVFSVKNHPPGGISSPPKNVYHPAFGSTTKDRRTKSRERVGNNENGGGRTKKFGTGKGAFATSSNA